MSVIFFFNSPSSYISPLKTIEFPSGLFIGIDPSIIPVILNLDEPKCKNFSPKSNIS